MSSQTDSQTDDQDDGRTDIHTKDGGHIVVDDDGNVVYMREGK